MIFHLTSPVLWQDALRKGFFETGSLQSEGFIHCCAKKQIAGVVERYYSNQPDMMVMNIDEDKLTSPLKYELSPLVNELFPHIYGIINLDAVESIHTLIR